MPSPGTDTPTAAPAELVVDVDAMRKAVAAARPSNQVIALTPEQLETLLLVVDENARLREELERARAILQGTVGVIDEVLEVGLQGNPASVPPPALAPLDLFEDRTPTRLAADGDDGGLED